MQIFLSWIKKNNKDIFDFEKWFKDKQGRDKKEENVNGMYYLRK